MLPFVSFRTSGIWTQRDRKKPNQGGTMKKIRGGYNLRLWVTFFCFSDRRCAPPPCLFLFDDVHTDTPEIFSSLLPLPVLPPTHLRARSLKSIKWNPPFHFYFTSFYYLSLSFTEPDVVRPRQWDFQIPFYGVLSLHFKNCRAESIIYLFIHFFCVCGVCTRVSLEKNNAIECGWVGGLFPIPLWGRSLFLSCLFIHISFCSTWIISVFSISYFIVCV